MAFKLIWSLRALADLDAAAEWSRGQAEAVVNGMDWMAAASLSLGRPFPGSKTRYWPIPPLGVVYRVESDAMYVLRVVDSRQRREPW